MGGDLRAHDAEILRSVDELNRAERVKAESRQLRGRLAEELTEDTAEFTGPTEAVLKFHGVYQQEDRDVRKAARGGDVQRRHIMMVRTRIPGGVVSADAYLAHDDVATRLGEGTMRVTTRQDFQLHGIAKGDLKESIRVISATLMTTLGGCGDQERNVMSCALPRADRLHGQVDELVAALARGLMPTTQAYVEIWLDGMRVAGEEPEVDTLYGPTYLPRKFKTAVALEGDNCVDIYSQDLGFVAHRGPGGGIRDLTVVVGGGLGRTHAKAATYPLLAQSLCSVTPDQVVEVARAVVGVQRDFGNRRDRRHARLKYLVEDRGLGWFRARVAERVGFTLGEPHTLTWDAPDDHLGWRDTLDGRLALGLFVENGRIADTEEAALRTTLRRIVRELRTGVVLTPQQNLILTGIHPADRGRVEHLLAEAAIRPLRSIPLVVREAMACPALPTCGQAVAESERIAPTLLRDLDARLRALGLANEPIGVRLTGCPNGCTRPYIGDVGIVGTTLGKYDLHLGGDRLGTRLNERYAVNVPLGDVVTALAGPLQAWRDERAEGEAFGDWCHRAGVAALAVRFAKAGAGDTTAPARGDHDGTYASVARAGVVSDVPDTLTAPVTTTATASPAVSLRA